MALLGEEIIAKMGFGAIGKNVSISDRASFYNCGNISIGSNVRIDDFCVLSDQQPSGYLISPICPREWPSIQAVMIFQANG
jgi:acetyltransferase-like isoleucine patch superfamily enzyme